MRKVVTAAAVALGLAIATTAHAAVIVLDFEGLQDNEQILNFYNGGTGGNGSAGPNYGIQFGTSALGLIDGDNGGSGNFANEPSPMTIAYFLDGDDLVMNVAAGFDTGFSFWYTSSTVASVTVYDGLNGTGNVLGVVNLLANFQDGPCTGDPNGGFCNFDPIGVAFAGVARSVSFAGTANQIGFDNITLGSQEPGDPAVPEPATMMLIGAGIGAGLLRRRSRK